MSYTLLSINNKKASLLITGTAIALLLWAFGSYLLYALHAPEPRICFPPATGCVSISSTGMTTLSGVFYRAVILPLSPFVSLSFLLGICFLTQLSPCISPWFKRVLYITGVILCPFFLIIAEAILNGTFHIPYLMAHIIFSELAFLMPVIYIVLYSFYLLALQKNGLVKLMCLLAILNIPCYLFMLLPVIPIHRFSTTMEWNLFILLSLWILLLGIHIKKQYQD